MTSVTRGSFSVRSNLGLDRDAARRAAERSWATVAGLMPTRRRVTSHLATATGDSASEKITRKSRSPLHWYGSL